MRLGWEQWHGGSIARRSSRRGSWQYDCVKYSVQGAIAEVKLDDLNTYNALTRKTVAALLDICAELHGRPDVAAVVFTAAGPHFCSGGAFGGNVPQDDEEYAPKLEPGASAFEVGVAENLPIARLLYLLSTLPQYKVAALRGKSLGAGISLAAAMDFVVAPERTALLFLEASRGLAACCSWQSTICKLGPMRMRRLCLLGAELEVRQAKHLGLVDEIVGTYTEADARALAQAQAVAKQSLEERCRLKTTGPGHGQLFPAPGGGDWEELVKQALASCPARPAPARFSAEMWPHKDIDLCMDGQNTAVLRLRSASAEGLLQALAEVHRSPQVRLLQVVCDGPSIGGCSKTLRRALALLHFCPAFTLALVSGTSALPMLCDAALCTPEASFDFSAEYMEYLPAELQAGRLNAKEAEELGLVEIAEHHQFLTDICRKLSECAPNAVAQSKAFIHKICSKPMEPRILEELAGHIARRMEDPEFQDSLRAVVDEAADTACHFGGFTVEDDAESATFTSANLGLAPQQTPYLGLPACDRPSSNTMRRLLAILPLCSALEVEVTVEAAWPRAALGAELLEGLAQLDRGADFLSELASFEAPDAEWRSWAARSAAKMTCCQGGSLYARLLSLRARHAYASAVVEAARGMDRADRAALAEQGLQSCAAGDPWALLQASGTLEVLCGDQLSKLSEHLAPTPSAGSSSQRGSPRQSELDHVLFRAASDEDSLEITGYADLGDARAATLLLRALFAAADALSASGRSGRVVFRHGTPGANAPRAVLGGYSLELMTRTADEVAKASDGPAREEAATSSCLQEVSDPAESFHGVDIAVIAQQFPSSASALCQLRDDLVLEAERPLAPWELTRLGARAAMRAVLAGNASALKGLQALGEVAQDYPSGWGRALSAGTAEDAQRARELMEEAQAIKTEDSLEVNGWQVPLKQRGVLSLLRSQQPLFRAAELLSREGVPQAVAFELLREAQSGQVPTKVDTGDPRLSALNAEASPAFDLSGRRQEMVGVGLVVDVCDRKQMQWVNKVLSQKHNALVWVRFQSSAALASLLQSALSLLVKGKPGPDVAKKYLAKLVKQHPEENLCDAEGEKLARTLFQKAWQKHSQGVPELLGGAVPWLFPAPSASLNGRMLADPERTLEQDIHQEFESLSMTFQMLSMRMGRVGQREITNFAYSARFHPMSFRMEPQVLSAWHEGISNAPARHLPLRPALLLPLPGASSGASAAGAGSTESTPAVHLVVLGSRQKLIQDAAALLEAYSQLFSSANRRYLHVAVSANCSAPFSAAAALRRCLRRKPLLELPKALQSLGDATASEILAACGAEVDLSFTAEDAAHCEKQKPLHDLGMAGATVLWVNGRLFQPALPLSAGILEHAERLEVEYTKGSPPESLMAKLNPSTNRDYLVAYALAVRARASVEAVQARSGNGAGEEAEQTQEDPRGMAEAAYNSVPEDLRLHIPPKGEVAPIRIFALLDPLGKSAQRLPPLLQLLHEELDAEVFLAMRPQRLAETPLKAYLRAAPAPKAPPGGLQALGEWDGRMSGARIELPPRRGQLLHLQLLSPEDWLCSAVDSKEADLDNIPADAPRNSPGAQVHVRYVVEALFLEGFAEDGLGRPATGRQLALTPLRGTELMAGDESMVVKSGYFQLRQRPGVYKLALSQKSEQLLRPKGLVQLADLAGRGSLLEALVAQGSGTDPYASLFTAASTESRETFEGGGGDPAVCRETIHIFSVASGLSYERLLRIMMLSVRKHTKCKLRLWLVANFLSASFRRILPTLSKEVGFEVSQVTYKWPTWLREQTSKQRVIWAYKILFLDVFFPAEVKRILFIDADEIVRADVEELWKMDIKGHSWGFVPFCGSGPAQSLSSSIWNSLTGKAKQEDLKNPETVGFRFWEQGFWKNHLGSRFFYHISAMFVVDLEVFRKKGAGDILREAYQSLTADPYSLSNLDQDLVNYIQSSLPIYSLPQEWLWCESWCSESSKQNAKNIDMCQHPLKKEGKLQNARRIAPEWTQYDNELQAIIDKIQ
ncbi:unnamed protein product [Effrenium voratum]|uniref:Glucosyltransferase 24 catalytic domain-containing protein n=1 Tax=Effrenium voratum TaxID=2562239 RepID=A0AA36HNP8_9DINO|nr:unnamed protein product [Effrenium voratum]